MNKRNILIPIKLPTTKFTFSSGTNPLKYLKDNYPVWYEANAARLKYANSLRLYAKTGEVYVLLDGNVATVDNSIVIEEFNQFIENVDLHLVSILAAGEVIIQIGTIG